MEHMTEVRGEAVHVCARILLKYTINIDEENKVGGKLKKILFKMIQQPRGTSLAVQW